MLYVVLYPRPHTDIVKLFIQLQWMTCNPTNNRLTQTVHKASNYNSRHNLPNNKANNKNNIQNITVVQIINLLHHLNQTTPTYPLRRN